MLNLIMMKSKRILFVLASIIATFGSLMHAEVTGTVLEDGTGWPVIGATVLQVGTTNGTVTDFDGFFELTVPAGVKNLVHLSPRHLICISIIIRTMAH